MKVAASPQVYMGAMPEGQGEQVSQWCFSGIGYLTAKDKDFSLALEMTIRECRMVCVNKIFLEFTQAFKV